jgi:hypothetical protein
MGTLPPKDLLREWSLENLTTEMATGHTLQHLVRIQQAIDAIQITLRHLRVDVDSLITHTRMKPTPKGRKKPSK